MNEQNSPPHKKAKEMDPTSNDRTFPTQEAQMEDVCLSAGRDLNIHGNVNLKFNYNRVLETKNTEPDEKIEFQVKDPIETFTGRKEVLEKLHQSIQECRNKDFKISILSQTSSITGLGGIGKSETVRMYIKQFGHEYDHIVWIDAENPSETTSQFKLLAGHKLKIRLKDHDDKPIDFSYILAEVYEKLCRKPKLLLIIFDNAEALDNTGPIKDGIRQFLPAKTTTIEPPIVLVTSRQQIWRDVNVIKLGLWEIEECIEHIFKRLKLQDTEENRKDANELAMLFDRLPIAIQVAVSVIQEQSEERRGISAEDYSIQNLISDYTKSKTDVDEDNQPISVQATIQKLLHITLKTISLYKQGQLAIRILAFMAYLSPTKVPKEIIQWLIPQNQQHMLDSALALLKRYSIIEGFTSYFTIHRVFQDVILISLHNVNVSESNPLVSICKDELTVLKELTDTFLARIKKENTEPTENYQDDVITNIIHTTEYIIQHSMTTEFYNYIAAVATLVASKQYEVAIKFFLALVHFDLKNTETPLNQKAFVKLWNIGILYYKNGNFNNALEMYNTLLHGGNIVINEPFKCTLVIPEGQEKVLGALHPKTLNVKHNLAVCLSDQGKIDEALKLLNFVLEAREKELGALHESTLHSKHTLAGCLIEQGKIDEALELLKDVLEGREKVLGALHSDTLSTKSNIALCLSSKDLNVEALRLSKEVLEAREEKLDALHPDLLASKHWIGKCLLELGRTEEALEIYSAVVEGKEKVLGALHPLTLEVKNNLAVCLSNKGEKEEALKQYYDVLEKREKVLGAHHPNTLHTKHCIARCLLQHGETDEALKLLYVEMEAREKNLGPIHHDTLNTKFNIVFCLSSQDKEEEALKICYDVLKEQEKVLEAGHPDILMTKQNIGKCLCEQGKTEEALKLNLEVLEAREKLFDADHPDVLAIKHNIGKCLLEQGKRVEALVILFCVLEAQEKVLGALHPHTVATKEAIVSSFSSDEESESEVEVLGYETD